MRTDPATQGRGASWRAERRSRSSTLCLGITSRGPQVSRSPTAGWLRRPERPARPRADRRDDGEPCAPPMSPPSPPGDIERAETGGPHSQVPEPPGVGRHSEPGLERWQACADLARGRLDRGRRADRCREESPSGRPRRSGHESRAGSRCGRVGQAWSLTAFGLLRGVELDLDPSARCSDRAHRRSRPPSLAF